jgi:hypothetical protein
VTDGDAGSVSASSKQIKKRDEKIACMVCGQNVNKSNMARHGRKKHGTAPAKSMDSISLANDSLPVNDVSEVSVISQDPKIARQFQKSRRRFSKVQYSISARRQ